MESTPTVFIVDNDVKFLHVTRDMLKAAQLAVIACESGSEFLDVYTEGHPGCLLLDIVMPEMSGLELLEELRRRRWFLPTIAMTAYGKVNEAVRAMKLGAIDFVEKPFEGKEALIKLVTNALQNATFAQQVRSEIVEMREKLSRLTTREREVLNFVVEGRSSKEIASEFDTKLRTVESQRFAIMNKLSADSIPQLVRMVLRYNVATQLDPALTSSTTTELD